MFIMPTIDYNSQIYAKWINSNVKQLGALLRPLGEIDIFDFFMKAYGDIPKQRSRLFGIQTQLVIFVIAFCLFGRNLAIASKMILSRPHSMISWCCLVPSASGVISNLVVILMGIGFPISCRLMIWFTAFSISLTIISNSLIILQKAYLVLGRKTWVLYVSAPSIVAQSAYVFIIMHCSFTVLEKKVGCMDYYPSFFIWYWLAVDLPINVLFSAVFCHTALKQYRIFGSEVWKNLAHDGIQAVSSATLCNIICSILIVMHMDAINYDMFLVIDWLVVTAMLINHCQKIGKNVGSAHHPKTNYMLNLSQIVTARSIN
ncbi:hypothetical protein BDF19DRAFT_118060 [Syncephalis fuscata]|nr:hypothetical protein BDF19DRAFT_118060 [Syncephalis fuscata]